MSSSTWHDFHGWTRVQLSTISNQASLFEALRPYSLVQCITYASILIKQAIFLIFNLLGVGGSGQTTGKTVAIIVGVTAGVGFLIILVLFLRGLKKKKDDGMS